jgi:iron-sulfur cluster repair protein YtfE (RIC family)
LSAHPGLRKRLELKSSGIVSQHRQLNLFVNNVAEPLRRLEWRQCETAVFQLQGGLDAHFRVEEQIVFPALQALHAELLEATNALTRDHLRLREDANQLVLAVVAADVPECWRRLGQLESALQVHERTEEEILDRV